MDCARCGTGMAKEILGGVDSWHCWICGHRVYPDLEQRAANIGTCCECGEDFEKDFSNRTTCRKCKEQDAVLICRTCKKVIHRKKDTGRYEEYCGDECRKAGRAAYRREQYRNKQIA